VGLNLLRVCDVLVAVGISCPVFFCIQNDALGGDKKGGYPVSFIS
jgi:hypothetical protein